MNKKFDDCHWDNLKELYLDKNLSTYQIAKIKNSSQMTIVNNLHKQKISKKKNTDWSDLYILYVTKKKTSVEIAKIKNRSKYKVLSELKKQGIKMRHGKEAISQEKLDRLSQRMKKNNPMRGKHHPKELRKKWSLERRGSNHPMYGKHQSEETRMKIRKTLIKKEVSKGENNPNFQGWKSREPYGKDFNPEFREMIRIRDNHVCMLCNKPQEEFKEKLHIHHIDYDKTNSFPQNCITLCNKCHSLTNGNRKHWKLFFQNLLKELYCYEYTEDQKIILDFTEEDIQNG